VLFVEDGNVEATNNRRERELRRLVLGRKNWLFTWGDDGGHRTARILSVIATAISHDVNPRAYLLRFVEHHREHDSHGPGAHPIVMRDSRHVVALFRRNLHHLWTEAGA
jgi:hypothetical protein